MPSGLHIQSEWEYSMEKIDVTHCISNGLATSVLIRQAQRGRRKRVALLLETP